MDLLRTCMRVWDWVILSRIFIGFILVDIGYNYITTYEKRQTALAVTQSVMLDIFYFCFSPFLFLYLAFYLLS